MGSYRRLLLVFAALPVILVTIALTYMAGMAVFEGEERTFWRALEWASETITTTGYGADARWTHPVMILFVIGLQFLGVFLVYMLVPLIMLPMLEARFERKLPRTVPKHLRGHVVIFSYGPAVETMIEELIDADLTQVVIELDDQLARDLVDQWQEDPKRYADVHLLTGPTLRGCFEAARLDSARAVVANGDDEENAIAVMIAQELGFTGRILAVAEEPHHRQPLEMAGASAVLTPRHVLGRALAARASHHLQPRVDGVQQLGPNLRVAEVRIHRQSELAGLTVREAEIARRTGATIIGQWRRGQLDTEPTPDTTLEARGLLVAIGETRAIEKLSELATYGKAHRDSGPILIAGYGEVGQKVAQLLREVGESLVIIDKNPEAEGVDIVGDVADTSTLDQLDLESAQAIVLALDSDSAMLFATLILKNRAPDLPTIARVNHAHNLERIYRAGADFALSIAQVSAQILVHELIGRDILALDAQLKILRTEASKLVGRQLSALEIRRSLGCSIVAIERGEEVLTELPADLRFEAHDVLYVCGPHSATERFAELYGDES